MPEPASSSGDSIGRRVRATRAAQGRSLAVLAEQAAIGKGSLSEIENDRRSPTLATLYAIANALRVPLATLIADQPGITVESPGISARLLDTTRAPDGEVVEVYQLRLAPGTVHTSPAHGPGVIEHLYLTRGRARVGPVRGGAVLSVGESATWESSRTHRYRALDGPADAVLIIRSPAPTGRRRGTQRG